MSTAASLGKNPSSCITVDPDTQKDDTVTIRDRDSLEQVRLPAKEVVDEIARRLRGK